MEQVDFASAKLITGEKPGYLPQGISFEQSIYPMNTYIKCNEYVFRELGNHVETSHCLLMQYDSWIIHPEIWNENWLEYDYMGAPWPVRENSFMANNGERVRVGNGGFSLRSKKLVNAPKLLGLPLTQEQGYYHEDGNITCYWRKELLEYGIKYAPIEEAIHFSYETPIPENSGIITFGFHRNMP
jgi:hypothetical protein